MNKQKVAVAFMRSANTNQSRKHDSIVQQYNLIEKYANDNQILLQAVFDNEILDSKQTLNGVLKYCKACPEIEYVIVTDSSRIARNYGQFLLTRNAFADHGIKLLTVNGKPHKDKEMIDIFIENLLSTYSAFENTGKAQETKKKMHSRVKLGYSVHRPPLGYTPTRIKGLYERNATASAIRHYCNEFRTGKITFNQLREAISKIYHPTDLLRVGRLKRLLSNPYYSGYVCYEDEKYKGLHEPIFSEAEQEELLELLDK